MHIIISRMILSLSFSAKFNFFGIFPLNSLEKKEFVILCSFFFCPEEDHSPCTAYNRNTHIAITKFRSCHIIRCLFTAHNYLGQLKMSTPHFKPQQEIVRHLTCIFFFLLCHFIVYFFEIKTVTDLRRKYFLCPRTFNGS